MPPIPYSHSHPKKPLFFLTCFLMDSVQNVAAHTSSGKRVVAQVRIGAGGIDAWGAGFVLHNVLVLLVSIRFLRLNYPASYIKAVQMRNHWTLKDSAPKSSLPLGRPLSRGGGKHVTKQLPSFCDFLPIMLLTAFAVKTLRTCPVQGADQWKTMGIAPHIIWSSSFIHLKTLRKQMLEKINWTR